jgi:hypothetical protein
MDIIRRKIGLHEVEIEGDIMHVRLGGPYLPEEARQFMTLSDQIFREHGSIYSLADLASAQPPGPETRRVLATWPYLGEYVSVMYGANLVQRAILQLLSSAKRLLSSTPTPLVQLCATESEARQFIADHRRLRAAAR